ncbi:hypothetical protein [Pantoea agglomerans]|uniref:hypothetical protein n=1 Tax=Enterobacter agglomerans TaxID=549 RepID=UPI0016541B81|nr:hypothetical protein [Pantoea agglomerans]
MKASVKEIFGIPGDIYPPIIQDLLKASYNKNYQFLALDDFELLNKIDSNYVYWIEILYRSHWAATSNLIRHDKWYELCHNSSIVKPNYIAFCSGLRGILECATDTYDALGSVPLTIAQIFSHVEDALLRRPTLKRVVSEELEDSLIHFTYARKLIKNEDAPKSHKAKTASDYIAQLDSEALPLKSLYAELCQVVHPAHQSTAWLVGVEEQNYKIQRPDDLAFILSLCGRYKECIEYILMSSVNTSMFIFKVINMLSCPELHNYSADKYDTSYIPLHNKIEAAIRMQNA